MIKTLTFAAVHMGVAFTVVYIATGNAALGGTVALIEPLCNTVAYYFHERIWERVHCRRLTEDGIISSVRRRGSRLMV